MTRDEVIEECARVCDRRAYEQESLALSSAEVNDSSAREVHESSAVASKTCAARIRSLKSPSLDTPAVQGPVAHAFAATETDRLLLAAHTSERYSGAYPWYLNLTMLRMHGDVVLTVRLPTVFGAPPGETSSVRFTSEMWREFVKMIGDADRVFQAADELDAMLMNVNGILTCPTCGRETPWPHRCEDHRTTPAVQGEGKGEPVAKESSAPVAQPESPPDVQGYSRLTLFDAYNAWPRRYNGDDTNRRLENREAFYAGWDAGRATPQESSAVPPVAEAQDMRAAFESWITSTPFERSIARFPDEHAIWPGVYRDIEVHLAWDAWQAALATYDASRSSTAAKERM